MAAPPHYPPLVEPLRPGPTGVPHSLSNPLTNLLCLTHTRPYLALLLRLVASCSTAVAAAGFVLAQGGAVELKFPGKNFFRSIPSNYGPYKHPGAVFADFAAQVGFL